MYATIITKDGHSFTGAVTNETIAGIDYLTVQPESMHGRMLFEMSTIAEIVHIHVDQEELLKADVKRKTFRAKVDLYPK